MLKKFNRMQKSFIQASKPGKLILLGEYAVLEQAPCLVAAAYRDCVVEIGPAKCKCFRLEASNPDIGDLEFVIGDNNELLFKTNISKAATNRLRFVIAVFKEIINECNGELDPATIKTDTQKLYHTSSEKLGLGASAAITVSL